MARHAAPHRPRRIAPRLASGKSRDPLAHGIPPHIKEALRMRAYAENKSVSWLLEEAIIAHFRYERPEYQLPKQVTPEEESRRRGTLQPERARALAASR